VSYPTIRRRVLPFAMAAAEGPLSLFVKTATVVSDIARR